MECGLVVLLFSSGVGCGELRELERVKMIQTRLEVFNHPQTTGNLTIKPFSFLISGGVPVQRGRDCRRSLGPAAPGLPVLSRRRPVQEHRGHGRARASSGGGDAGVGWQVLHLILKSCVCGQGANSAARYGRSRSSAAVAQCFCFFWTCAPPLPPGSAAMPALIAAAARATATPRSTSSAESAPDVSMA